MTKYKAVLEGKGKHFELVYIRKGKPSSPKPVDKEAVRAKRKAERRRKKRRGT